MSAFAFDAAPFVFEAGAELVEPGTAPSSLTPEQVVQLASALTFHALVNPGQRIDVSVYSGDVSRMPALTDDTTIDGSASIDAMSVGTVTITSTALGTSAATADPLDPIQRTIRLGHADATPATTQPPAPPSLPRRAYRELERRAPLMIDALRETIMQRRERAISAALPGYPAGPADAHADVIDSWASFPADPPESAPRAVLFGLHWLQTGGAERWAIESIQLAKDAGFLPIVVTDQNSVHPWATRPELEGALIIELSFPEHEHSFDLALAEALLANYDVRGIMLHHCKWLYQALPYIRRVRPEIPVVDSLHIVEYLGGGYPGFASHYDEFIDTHHVISPQLVDWLAEVQGVDRAKLALAPLGALTAGASAGFAPRTPGEPFTISFVGRLSRQKRPDVFLGLVRQLAKSGIPFRAIMHGDGELRELTDGIIDSLGLRDAGVFEQRFEDTPVAETLAESDLLVVTSINEGITLTTFEAIAAGLPVLSSDVGSQRTIVQGELLLPRPARPFIVGATQIIAKLDASERLREQLWQDQHDRVTDFTALPTAHDFTKELFASWQE